MIIMQHEAAKTPKKDCHLFKLKKQRRETKQEQLLDSKKKNPRKEKTKKGVPQILCKNSAQVSN